MENLDSFGFLGGILFSFSTYPSSHASGYFQSNPFFFFFWLHLDRYKLVMWLSIREDYGKEKLIHAKPVVNQFVLINLFMNI